MRPNSHAAAAIADPAAALGIPGDPYRTLLGLADENNAELTARLRSI